MPFLAQVEQSLLKNGLALEGLQTYLNTIHQHKIDYSDLYFQGSRHESWVLEDGIITVSYTHLTLPTKRIV